MISFHVQDMTCGHCVRSITQAVQAIDPGAQVQADLAAHQVHIASAHADAAQLRAVIEQAGYTAVSSAVRPGADAAVPSAVPRSGCCCR